MIEKDYRPKLDIPKTASENFWDIIGYTAFLGSLVFLGLVFGDLPDEVPAHYNASGEVDRWGSKFELFILPGIGLFILLLMQILERHPETHNYPQRINETNAQEFYLNSRKMINLIKNLCLVIFSLILIESVSIAMEWIEGSGPWLFILLTISAFVPIVIGLLNQRKIR
ncbi:MULTISPECIES: DUF1648 domain-containing protein [Allobacillus]|uniref:DUF1648 domain-containing protein n=1 Tax=Allobacillus salarius TaxID=1955272 RepID=A0A556PPC6_9BACI|nr:DUF1648 domain-containing protein [Allobacillus salarius]TSJ66242.1 DUF1648 domain-containing protein [Allobacillus salarius]